MSKTGPDLDALLLRHSTTLARALPEHSLKKRGDLSLPDFLAGQERGWTADELKVLNRSSYAARLQRLVWRVTPPSLDTLARKARGQLHRFEAEAFAQYQKDAPHLLRSLSVLAAELADLWQNAGASEAECVARLRNSFVGFFESPHTEGITAACPVASASLTTPTQRKAEASIAAAPGEGGPEALLLAVRVLDPLWGGSRVVADVVGARIYSSFEFTRWLRDAEGHAVGQVAYRLPGVKEIDGSCLVVYELPTW